MKFIEIKRPEYSYLKLTPNNSLKNTGTDKIAQSIASLASSLVFKREAGFIFRKTLIPTKLSITTPGKVSFYIYLTKDSAEFYFIVPTSNLSVLQEKIRGAWPTITISHCDSIPLLSENSTKYSLGYTQEDALSLDCDKRDNSLITSNLNVLSVLEDSDRVALFYNFLPTSQRGWWATYKQTIDKIKNNTPTDKEKLNALYLLRLVSSLLQNFSNSLSGLFSPSQPYLPQPHPGSYHSLLNQYPSYDHKAYLHLISDDTRKKQHETIIDTQILVMSESTSPIRQFNNARSLAQSFNAISNPEGGNTLAPKKYRKTFRPLDYSLTSAPRNKVSTREAQNFVSLPGRELLERHPKIQKTDTQETLVPEELRDGVMCIGKNTFRGNVQKAYLSTDPEYQQLCLVIAGPTRAGKTTLLSSLAKDAIANQECVIMMDFIENCEASEEVSAHSAPDNTLRISCDNLSSLQGLGYNELSTPTEDPMDKYIRAKRQTQQLLTLINSINTDDKTLAPRMERFLTCASLVVFIQDGSIKDVFDVLTDYNIRSHFTQTIPRSQRQNLSEYLVGLDELDEIDSKTKEVVGTKFSSVSGIIDRLQKLKANPYMELMLKQDTSNNINLIDEIQKPQLIIIQMPEKMFNTDSERDTYCTYWMSKIWLSLQLRADLIRDKSKRVKVNLIIDELYQVHHTEDLLTEKLSRLAKFRLKPIISCHYLNQIKRIRDELRSANASYMLISGCDKKNFDELKEELYPFEVEDLLKLPRWYSMNLIKTKAGYARFITDLTQPM